MPEPDRPLLTFPVNVLLPGTTFSRVSDWPSPAALRGLKDAFVSALALSGGSPPWHSQAVLADFLAEGHFLRHIRRMRSVYSERQEALVGAAERELAGLLDVRPSETGLQIMGWLPDGVNDRDVSRRAADSGVVAPPISSYCLEAPPRKGLLLGYAAHTPCQIRSGVRRLATVLRDEHGNP